MPHILNEIDRRIAQATALLCLEKEHLERVRSQGLNDEVAQWVIWNRLREIGHLERIRIVRQRKLRMR